MQKILLDPRLSLFLLLIVEVGDLVPHSSAASLPHFFCMKNNLLGDFDVVRLDADSSLKDQMDTLVASLLYCHLQRRLAALC